MKCSIKDLMPNPNKRYKQGFYDSHNPKRYFGKRPIIYRSSLELRFMNWCETSSVVQSWSSEPEPGIPYFDAKNNYHTYFPDFIVMFKDGTRLLVEVKPKSEVPINELQIRTNPIKAKNAMKWKAAIEFAKRNNMKFVIVTEDFFGKQHVTK